MSKESTQGTSSPPGMSSLKSLKLGGVRNALRKLLRKKSSTSPSPSPAVDSSGASTPAGSQLAADSNPIHHHDQAQLPNGKSQPPASPSPSPLPVSVSATSADKTDLPPALAALADSSTALEAGDVCNGVEAGEITASLSGPAAQDDNSAMPVTTAAATANTPLGDQKQPHQRAPPQQRVLQDVENKENVPPGEEELENAFAALKLDGAARADGELAVPDLSFLSDPVVAAERAEHLRFIGEALDMARLALRINETPVGCVLVHNGKVIARGMNATNVTRNGTRHAEYMALSALFSYAPRTGLRATRLKPKEVTDKDASDARAAKEAMEKEAAEGDVEVNGQPASGESNDEASDTLSFGQSPHEGNEDGSKGHLYPYGQKILPVERVDRSIVEESILYVTVEPCIMCASLLRQMKVKKVYFGAVNDKFGGTGGVFSVHANSLPVSEDGQTASAHPTPKPIQLPDGTGGSLGVSFPPGGGDGGNVERGYEIEGGWGRDEAVALLRRFYVQENGRAPVPRKKEGRAARLAAMMEQDGSTTPDGEGDGEQDSMTPNEADNGGGNGTNDGSENESKH